MKKIKIMLSTVLACISTLFISCIRDNSVYGGQPISQITFTDSLKTNFFADKFDTLTIEAPRFIQTNTEKPVRYEWEIDYKPAGNENVLTYVCDKLGSFHCRLKISNEDGATFYRFILLVKSPYHQGVMVMSRFNNQSMFSFKREDTDKPFYKHVYASNNPGIPLGSEPVAVFQQNDNLYFGSNTPARMIKADAKTMEALLVSDYEGESIGGINGIQGAYGLTVMGGGNSYNYDTKQDMFMNHTMNSIKSLSPNVSLSDHMVYVYDSKKHDYPYFYDNREGELFTVIQYKAKKIEIDQFRGKELLWMITCNNEKEVLLLLRDKTTSDVYLAHYIHETYTLRSIKKIPLEKGKELTACIASQRVPILYYGLGNKVYVHNYLADNFSEKPLYILGSEGDTVASMLFSPTQEKLYIGINRKTGGEYRGDVFCFDAEKNNRLWHEKGIAGEIVFMGYKR